MRSQSECPNGYPYVLCVKIIENKQSFIVSKEKEYQNKFAINVLDLTKQWGHNRTHLFLKKINTNWICRAGIVYFKGIKKKK